MNVGFVFVFCLAPIQRIAKYKLLLENLSKASQGPLKFEFNQLKLKMDAVLEEINTAQKNHDGSKLLLELQKRYSQDLSEKFCTPTQGNKIIFHSKV